MTDAVYNGDIKGKTAIALKPLSCAELPMSRVPTYTHIRLRD